jgi:K+:H+ antiporter
VDIACEQGAYRRFTARRDGAEVIVGNAAAPAILAAANLAGARRLSVTIPGAFEAGRVVQQARALRPSLDILARAHSDAAVDHLVSLGATLVISGEREIARRMLEQVRSGSLPA